MTLDRLLASMSAETLIAMWRDLARSLMGRGCIADDEMAILNTIAMAYGEATGRVVSLSGPKGHPRTFDPCSLVIN